MPTNLLIGNPVQAFNEGQQIGRQNRFNQLAGQALAAPPDQRDALFAEAAQADPRQALALRGAVSQQDDIDEDRRNKAIVNMARLYVSAPPQARPQIRAQLTPSLAKFGIDAANVSPEDFDKTAQALVDAWTPANQMPSGLREFEGMTKGLSPEDVARARRINLGLDGRASNAGFGFETAEGADGRKYLRRQNPRTGEVEVYDPTTGDFAPVGGAPQPPRASASPDPTIVGPVQEQPVGAPMAAPGVDTAPVDDANRWLKQGLPEREIGVRLAAKYGGQLGGSKYPTVVIRNGVASAGSSGGQPERQPANPALMVSRAPEDTALATQDAKNASDLSFLPRAEKIKADAAVDQATRTAAGKAAVEASAKDAEEGGKRQRDATETLGLLDAAERILPSATGSRVGQFVDNAAATAGKSTEGARATAQLQTIAGQLTSKMPRMQGPQSDNDVALYKQMAGDLANPDIPVETRRAALQTIRDLNRKYAGSAPASAPAAPAGGNFGHLWN